MADDQKPKADPKVKELLARDLATPLDEVVDAVTAAELEKWFGLPSYQQVADGVHPAAAEDPDMLAVRERRDKALAAVDPAFLASHLRRIDRGRAALIVRTAFAFSVEPMRSRFDRASGGRHFAAEEPRTREVPDDIRDGLHECTTQALLRDLHRPELQFDKTFEVVDVARVDGAGEVAVAMATDLRLPPFGRSPFVDGAAAIAQSRLDRSQPWPALFAAKPLPNRRVQE